MFGRSKAPTLDSIQGADRLASALGDLQRTDPKEYSQVLNRVGVMSALLQLAPASEEVLWIQYAMLCTDAYGEQDISTFSHGLLALTTERLVFSGESTMGNSTGTWGLSQVSGVSLVRNGFTRGNDLLRLSAGPEQRGFAVKSVRATQELASRLDQAKRAVVSKPSRPEASVADELMKWASLRDQGIISEEEFAHKKAQLL
jgi:Short C-terminal domain